MPCYQRPADELYNLEYWSYALLLLGVHTTFLFEDEIIFECDQGYHIPWLSQNKNTLRVTCQSDGQWSTTLPYFCTTVRCPPIQRLPNTKYQVRKSSHSSLKSHIEFGDQVAFYCSEGYEIGDHQNLTVTCTKIGKYDRNLPEQLCQRKCIDIVIF